MTTDKKVTSYYDVGGISVKKVIAKKCPPNITGTAGFYWGCIVKYLLRCGWKNQETMLEDLIKAQNYLSFLIKLLEKERGTPK